MKEDEFMDFIEEMKKLIDERSHYQGGQKCNAPATLKEVRDFERDMNIVLPENYVRYLTELGNGGPGGYCRIYSLDYVKSEGSKPMNVVWKLRKPIPAKYLKKTNQLTVG